MKFTRCAKLARKLAKTIFSAVSMVLAPHIGNILIFITLCTIEVTSVYIIALT